MGEIQAIPTPLPPEEVVRPFAAVLPSLPRRAAVAAQAIPATAETPEEPQVRVARPLVVPLARAPVAEPPITVAPDLVGVAATMVCVRMKLACLESSSKEDILQVLQVLIQKPAAAVEDISEAVAAVTIPAVPAARAISVA